MYITASLILKLSYKVESTQSKNLCECWQYYKNF